jgi:hypothetical protein
MSSRKRKLTDASYEYDIEKDKDVIVFDWRGGVEQFFPEFFEKGQLSDQVLPQELWKLIFEYQHELKPRTDGVYRTSDSFIKRYGMAILAQFTHECKQLKYASTIFMLRDEDIIGLPTPISCKINYSERKALLLPPWSHDPLGFYEFRSMCFTHSEEDETNAPEFLCGQISWCGRYLRVGTYLPKHANGFSGVMLEFVPGNEQNQHQFHLLFDKKLEAKFF